LEPSSILSQVSPSFFVPTAEPVVVVGICDIRLLQNLTKPMVWIFFNV
jgi:hypothetical protein